MKKVIKEEWESYDQDGLDIALTVFADGVSETIKKSIKAAEKEAAEKAAKRGDTLDKNFKAKYIEYYIESVTDDLRLEVLSFLNGPDGIDLNAGARYESTQYDNIILESNKWMYGEVLNEAPTKKKASTKKKIPYVHKGKSSFTIKKIGDTYGTDKLKAQAEFEVYVSMFESSKDKEGLKTSNLSTTLMDKKAYKSNLKDGKFITLKGDPADAGFKRKVLEKDFSKVLEDVKELRSDYLKGV